MNVIEILKLCMPVTLVGCVAVANAEEADYVYSFHRPNLDIASEKVPKAIPAGFLELAGDVKIPVYSLVMSSGRTESGPETFEPKSSKLDLTIKPEVAAQLDAYAYNQGIILVPRNWKVRSGGIGFDGSMYLLFAPDKSGQIYLLYSSSGACYGCALTSASLYFKEAKKMAKEDEFGTYRHSSAIQMVTLNKFEKAYSVKVKNGNPVDGIAYFDSADDFPFFDVQISAPLELHYLATAVLNQFKLKTISDEP